MSRLPDYTYAGVRRVVYGGGATFVPVCPTCGRFVKPDPALLFREADGAVKPGPNATCTACGRVEMPFEGYY